MKTKKMLAISQQCAHTLDREFLDETADVNSEQYHLGEYLEDIFAYIIKEKDKKLFEVFNKIFQLEDFKLDEYFEKNFNN